MTAESEGQQKWQLGGDDIDGHQAGHTLDSEGDLCAEQGGGGTSDADCSDCTGCDLSGLQPLQSQALAQLLVVILPDDSVLRGGVNEGETGGHRQTGTRLDGPFRWTAAGVDERCGARVHLLHPLGLGGAVVPPHPR